MKYGALNTADIRVIESVLHEFRGCPIRYMEIGVYNGETARGIRDFCAAQNSVLEYWGVDNGAQNDGQPPFPGATMVLGDSAHVFSGVPDDLDVAMIDGCHSRNHVILDTVNYSTKIKRGGFIIYHDTSPEIQHTMREGHGPDIPQFYNAVLEGLILMRWPWPEWVLWKSEYEPGHPYGGTTVYKRIG